MKKALLLIDPQNDFCDKKGSLSIPGADSDSLRLEKFITKKQHEISAIFTTLDSHYAFHIAHPLFWQDTSGKAPAAFTIISLNDFNAGKYKVKNPDYVNWAQYYLEELERQKKYQLCIWPEHCLVGSWGHNLYPPIYASIYAWEKANPGKHNNYIYKGINPKTEHYSAFAAEVLDTEDPKSDLNMNLIQKLSSFDEVFVGGQALSHCVSNSLRDLVKYLPAEKIILLLDTTSPVPGFEEIAQIFLEDAKKTGIKLAKTSNL